MKTDTDKGGSGVFVAFAASLGLALVSDILIPRLSTAEQWKKGRAADKLWDKGLER